MNGTAQGYWSAKHDLLCLIRPPDQVDGCCLDHRRLVIREAVAEKVDPGLQACGTQLGNAADPRRLRLVIEMGEEAVALALADA